MQVVVGTAPAVAGEDAQDQVGAAGQAEEDDLGCGEAELLLLPQHDDDQLDQLDEQVEHVDEDHTLLSLSVGIFLVGSLQSGTI